ncbi:MAG: hypothetical protein HY435_01780 [Candidatus Liptonbacteria bacterium]|nr:hypothetical protein [Candidatus Liptonbacteria bacterium]
MSEKGVFVEVPGSNGYCVNLVVDTPSGPQVLSLMDRFSRARNLPVWMLRSNLRSQLTFLAMQIADPATRQYATTAAQNVIFTGEPLPDDGRLYTLASCETIDCDPTVCPGLICSSACSNCLKALPRGGGGTGGGPNGPPVMKEEP